MPDIENTDRTRCDGCGLSFHEFVRQAWHVIEPETPFVDGWAIGAMAEHLQAVTEGQIKRLLINVPRGCRKAPVAEDA